jgi:hypothetical protein
MQALSMAIAANAVCKTERFMWCVLPVEFLGSPFFAGFALNSTLNSTLPIRTESSQFSSRIVRLDQSAVQAGVAIVSRT